MKINLFYDANLTPILQVDTLFTVAQTALASRVHPELLENITRGLRQMPAVAVDETGSVFADFGGFLDMLSDVWELRTDIDIAGKRIK